MVAPADLDIIQSFFTWVHVIAIFALAGWSLWWMVQGLRRGVLFTGGGLDLFAGVALLIVAQGIGVRAIRTGPAARSIRIGGASIGTEELLMIVFGAVLVVWLVAALARCIRAVSPRALAGLAVILLGFPAGWAIGTWAGHFPPPDPKNPSHFAEEMHQVHALGVVLVPGLIALGLILADLIPELLRSRARRVYAVSRHSLIEAHRRWLAPWVVAALFAIVLLFAHWVVPPDRPGELSSTYVTTMATSISLLLILVALVLAPVSMPTDIQTKTLQTVVTKPVHRFELVLGRILGFSALMAVLVAVLGALSLVYIHRQVNQAMAEKTAEIAQLSRATDPGSRDRRRVLDEQRDQLKAHMTARVPLYATAVGSTPALSFLDVQGQPKDKGVNVGNEWEYRSYIQGQSPAAAIWHFHNAPVDQWKDQGKIPIELTFDLFRTTKGRITREGREGVAAQIRLINAKHPERSLLDQAFYVREYHVNHQDFPHYWRGHEAEQRRQFENVLAGSDGAINIEVRCVSVNQFLGMAPHDLYFLLDNDSFDWNYIRSMIGVWLQVSLIIGAGVTAGTLFSWPVAVLATVAFWLGGQFFYSFVTSLLQPGNDGPFVAMIKIASHASAMAPLEPNFWSRLSEFFDAGFMLLLRALTYILPDLSVFDTSSYVANGFSIPASRLMANLAFALGYGVAFLVLAHYFFKAREVAA